MQCDCRSRSLEEFQTPTGTESAGGSKYFVVRDSGQRWFIATRVEFELQHGQGSRLRRSHTMLSWAMEDSTRVQRYTVNLVLEGVVPPC